MAIDSPYRTLSAAERMRLLQHDIAGHRESRDGYIQSIVARGGGFRPAKLRQWPPEQLAREVARHNLESPQDQLRLMIALYLELEPALQIEFLDATAVRHQQGQIPDDTEPPYAPADRVRAAAAALLTAHGDDARRYLQTIAYYNAEAWPGLEQLLAEEHDT
jgi:hypothetical protein